MKTFTKTLLPLSLVLILVSCGPEEEVPVAPTNPDATDINDYLGSLPDWDNSVPTPAATKMIQENVTKNEGNVPYLYNVVEKEIVKSLNPITAPSTNKGKIFPGALIEGNSLETGDLKLINVSRAPVTIATDLPIPIASQVVENPNSVTIEQVISDFKIQAGDLEEGSKAGAGTMFFDLFEASSFHQSMLALGIGAGFTDPQTEVGLDGSADVKTSRKVRTHTVAAKFVQKKFTVRIADDLLPTSADFFSRDFTMDKLKALESAGTIGAENIPLYIESVDYGRILVFTTTSDEVDSYEALDLALRASMSDYVNGNGSLTKAQRDILEHSRTTIFSAGGTEEGANGVIRDLDWSKFFVAAPASTAVPISFTVRTLGGRKTVSLVESALFNYRESLRAPSSYDVEITLQSAKLTGGVCVRCTYNSTVKKNSQIIPDPLARGHIYGIWDGPEFGGSQKHTTLDPNTRLDIISGYCTAAFSPPTCFVQNLSNTQTQTYLTLDNLKPGESFFTHTLNELLRTMEFRYKIKKTPNY